MWTSFCAGQRVVVPRWGVRSLPGPSPAPLCPPRLGVLFLPTPALREELRAAGSSGGGGPVGLQPRKAPAPCRSSSRQMSSAARGEGVWPSAARRGSGRSSLSSLCRSSPGGLRGVGALLGTPGGHTATLCLQGEGCSLPRCSHASLGNLQPRQAAKSKQNLRLRVGRSMGIKARFPLFFFYFVQKGYN